MKLGGTNDDELSAEDIMRIATEADGIYGDIRDVFDQQQFALFTKKPEGA